MKFTLGFICVVLATSTLAAVPRSLPRAKTDTLLEIRSIKKDLPGIESLQQDSPLILAREEFKHKKTKSGATQNTEKAKSDAHHSTNQETKAGNGNAKPDGNTKIIHVDIDKLAKGGKVIDSYTPDFTYKLPDNIPEHGVKMSEGFWREQAMADEFKNSDSISQTDRMQPCSATKSTLILEQGTKMFLIDGNTHQISASECAPGSITKTYGVSYSWSVSGQLGPDMKGAVFKNKAITDKLDKFGARAQVAYTWGSVTTTGYAKTWSMPQQHPFVLTFKPNILLFNARGRIAQVNGLGAICSTTPVHWLTVHLPMKDRSDCHKEDACGPAGNYDSCFFMGAFARHKCPGRNLGPTPDKGLQCPTHLYDRRFLTRDGKIIG